MKYRPVLDPKRSALITKLRRIKDAAASGPWRFDGEHFVVGDSYLIFESGDPETQLVELVSEHLGELLDMLDVRYVIYEPQTKP